MIEKALRYLVTLGNTRIEDVNGQTYSTMPMQLIRQPATSAIVVNSLSGLVDYLKSNFDHVNELVVHVESPTLVSVFGHLNNDSERDFYIKAEALLPSFRFGNWMDSESFNIALQSVFVTNEDRDIMLKIVGNIKDENVTAFGDDGVSQQVQTKTGVATVANVKVPNPVILKPYRTFVEVQQPESAFVFRMRTGHESPHCALFEADGGAWKIEAMDKVNEYLKEKLIKRLESGSIVLIA